MSKLFQLLFASAVIFSVHSLFTTDATFAERGTDSFNEFSARVKKISTSARNFMPNSVEDASDKVRYFVDNKAKKGQAAFRTISDRFSSGLQNASAEGGAASATKRSVMLGARAGVFGAGGVGVLGSMYALSCYGRKYGWNLTEEEIVIVNRAAGGNTRLDIEVVTDFIKSPRHNDYYFKEYLLQVALSEKNVGMLHALLQNKYKDEDSKKLVLLAHELCDLGVSKKVSWHPEARRRRAWLSGWMLPDRIAYRM